MELGMVIVCTGTDHPEALRFLLNLASRVDKGKFIAHVNLTYHAWQC